MISGISVIASCAAVGAQQPGDGNAPAIDNTQLAGAPANNNPAPQAGTSGNAGAPPPAAGTAADAGDVGPVRLAHFTYLNGSVTWRPEDSADWSAAVVNLPLRQDAQIAATGGARAEIQFDDGSLLRLGAGAVLTIQALRSDSGGEYTELHVAQGTVSLRLRSDRSVYQIDTPAGAINAAGPANIRVGVDARTRIGVLEGEATVEGAAGKTGMQGGEYLELTASDTVFTMLSLPPVDAWDDFCNGRDRLMKSPPAAASHLPTSIDLVAGNLDNYGTWQNDPACGEVWTPSDQPAGWSPYRDGQWTWVEPFGWTWVAREPWGWAPYHYGTWTHWRLGWSWAPGPAQQYWSPGAVAFTSSGGLVAWIPLGPSDVRYPAAIAIGYQNGNWWASFSIGGTAIYLQGDEPYFQPVPWNNGLVNAGRAAATPARFKNPVSPGTARRIIPVNAQVANAATTSRVDGLDGRGGYRTLSAADAQGIFEHGDSVVSDDPARGPEAGPVVIPPSPQSFTPTHTFVLLSPAMEGALGRPVYLPASERAPTPPENGDRAAPLAGAAATEAQTTAPDSQIGDHVPPSRDAAKLPGGDDADHRPTGASSESTRPSSGVRDTAKRPSRHRSGGLRLSSSFRRSAKSAIRFLGKTIGVMVRSAASANNAIKTVTGKSPGDSKSSNDKTDKGKSTDDKQ
jgi:hypothetical protein